MSSLVSETWEAIQIEQMCLILTLLVELRRGQGMLKNMTPLSPDFGKLSHFSEISSDNVFSSMKTRNFLTTTTKKSKPETFSGSWALCPALFVRVSYVSKELLPQLLPILPYQAEFSPRGFYFILISVSFLFLFKSEVRVCWFFFFNAILSFLFIDRYGFTFLGQENNFMNVQNRKKEIER